MTPARLLMALYLWLIIASNASAQTPRSWNFEVFLNDKKVGWHHFVLAALDGEMQLTSTASFDFKVFLFYPVKYRHRAVERWRDGCLVAIESHTEKRGKTMAFVGQQTAEGFSVSVGEERRLLPSCVRSFTYWNLDWLDGDALLNGENGEYWSVAIDRKKTPSGEELTLTTPAGDIRLRYDQRGDWQYLESKITAVGMLSYRRQVGEASP